MNENTLSSNLERIKDATDRIRVVVDEPTSSIEDVATAVENLPIGGETDIYKVATIQERNALNPNEGDMCVVIGSSIGNWEEGTSSAIITFPETVILPSAYSNYYSARLRGNTFEGYIDLYEQSFRIESWSDIRMRVEYNSNDGIEYTRQYLTCEDMNTGQSLVDGDTVTLPEEVGIQSMGDPFDANIGYFMQAEVQTFDGIFTYDGSNWNYSYVGVNEDGSNYLNGRKGYTNTGLITGSFPQNSRDDFRKLAQYTSTALYLPNFAQTFNDNGITGPYFRLKLNTSSSTSITSMFAYSKFKEIWADFDTSNVTEMSDVFASCSQLEKIYGLEYWDVSKVTTMQRMFQSCSKLSTLTGLEHWNTSSVTSMYCMFNGSGFTSLDLSSFNTANVTTMGNIFNGCRNLLELNLSSWVTSGIDISDTNSYICMFGCPSLQKLDVRNMDFTKFTTDGSVFGSTLLKLKSDCLVIVKNDIQKQRVLSLADWLTNVKTVAEYEATL